MNNSFLGTAIAIQNLYILYGVYLLMRCGFAISFVFLLAFSFVSAAIPDDCATNMVGYYRFENNLVDSLGEAPTGSWSDGTGSYWAAQIGNGAKLSGSNYVSIPDNDALDLHGSFTLQFWMRKMDALYQDGTLVDKGIYKVSYIDDGPASYLEATVNGVTVESSGRDFTSGIYFVTLAWNQQERVLELYVNGTLEDNEALNLVADRNILPITVGEGFEGIIDELTFYTEWHNISRINQDYERAAGGKDYCYLPGAGGVSSTRSDFTIAGCYDGDLGVDLSVGSCSRDGNYYCRDPSEDGLMDTLNDLDACSRGLNDLAGVADPCCPRGYYCDDEDINGVPFGVNDWKCVQRTVDCSDYDEEGPCTAAQCFWIVKDGEGICSETPDDFSCSFYEDPDDCEEDYWNLGRLGTGTDVCGTYVADPEGLVGYIIPEDSCMCVWDSGECYLAYDVIAEISGPGVNHSFTCYKDFETGPCLEGLQHVNWSAEPEASSIIDFIVGSEMYERIRNATKCIDGELDRSCGDPIIKVPFFSSFSLVAAFLLIGLFYWLKHR